MYDIPEVRGALDRLWRALRDAMRSRGLADVPDELSHIDSGWDAHWGGEAVYFTHVCGRDFVRRFPGRYRVIATPRYAAEGCEGDRYRSFVVIAEGAAAARLSDLRGARLVVNGAHSHSGAWALAPLVAPHGALGDFFGSVTESGSHEASLSVVRSGGADVAAIDCITYGLLARHRPDALGGVRVVTTTPLAPAPPYVAPASFGPAVFATMRDALAEVIADPALEDVREALLLRGVSVRDDEAVYQAHFGRAGPGAGP